MIPLLYFTYTQSLTADRCTLCTKQHKEFISWKQMLQEASLLRQNAAAENDFHDVVEHEREREGPAYDYSRLPQGQLPELRQLSTTSPITHRTSNHMVDR